MIDSGYRGEVTAKFKRLFLISQGNEYTIGERFAQLVVMAIPAVEFVEAEELSESERGVGGYGSSGK